MTKFLPAVLVVMVLLIMATAPLYAGEGRDEYEPNDTMELADLIEGLEIKGNVDEVDTDDWFKLAGQEGYRAEFTVFQDDDEVEVDFEILSVDYEDMDLYEVVGSAEDWGSGESITCDIPRECYIRVWHWEGAGDYTIKIQPMVLEVDFNDYKDEDYDEIEPNDDEDLADFVSDFDIYGYCDEDDVDWYYTDGQEGFNPTFTIFFDDEDVEIDFEVFSGDDNVGGAYDYGSGESLTCEVPGQCYIKVYHWSGEGEYVLLIEP